MLSQASGRRCGSSSKKAVLSGRCSTVLQVKNFRLAGTAFLGAVALTAALAPNVGDGAAAPASSLQQILDRAGRDSLPFNPELASVSCPVERGPVKMGSDADRFRVSTTVVSTSIGYLRARPKPTTYPRNNRIAPNELKTWQVGATMTQYKIESDGDIHIVLRDSTGHTMIAEIPYLSCVPTSSRWRSQIASARAAFAHSYYATTSWKYTKRSVTVRGLGLFDPPHGQTGASTNGIELHPVTAITFH